MEGQRMAELTVKDVQPKAQLALQASPIFALRDVQVHQTGESLLLSGHVASFYHKQLAQEVVRAVAGGVEVVNTIDVS
jgi:osmotically-inducible protein OsmY